MRGCARSAPKARDAQIDPDDELSRVRGDSDSDMEEAAVSRGYNTTFDLDTCSDLEVGKGAEDAFRPHKPPPADAKGPRWMGAAWSHISHELR